MITIICNEKKNKSEIYGKKQQWSWLCVWLRPKRHSTFKTQHIFALNQFKNTKKIYEVFS